MSGCRGVGVSGCKWACVGLHHIIMAEMSIGNVLYLSGDLELPSPCTVHWSAALCQVQVPRKCGQASRKKNLDDSAASAALSDMQVVSSVGLESVERENTQMCTR